MTANDDTLTVFPDRLVRFLGADLEVRNDGRTIYGTLVPFNTRTPIGGMFEEEFAPGAFTKTIAERGDRVKLTVGHAMDRLPIGRAIELREDPSALVGAFHVSETADGDDALQRVRDGAVDSFSIEFQPVRTSWNEDRTHAIREEAKLLGASLVAYPAYESAIVAGVRSVMDITAAMEAHPELGDQIRDLVRSYTETLNRDAAPAGTSPNSNDTPPPAGHLSDTASKQVEAVRASLARLIGASNGPDREDRDQNAGDR